MGKRDKLKKVLSPPSPFTPPQPTEDDQDLMDELFAQLDSKDVVVQKESETVLEEIQLRKESEKLEAQQKQDPKSRFKARQARKAAQLEQIRPIDDPESDAQRQRMADEEQQNIDRVADEMGLRIHQITPDGHCLFSAVADQLSLLGILPEAHANYRTTRQTAANYIYTHPDDFLPFLPTGEDDGVVPPGSGIMTPAQFQEYCVRMRDTGVWGGEPEITALCRAYNTPINVVQGGSPFVVVHSPSGETTTPDPKGAVNISYHRNLYGLGEHYNSLVPKSKGLAKITEAIQNVIS